MTIIMYQNVSWVGFYSSRSREKATPCEPTVRCYKFKCDLCDADYVGYTCRHLHQRIDEHKNSVVDKHVRECHREEPARIEHCFSILKRCQSNNCLLYEMLFIRVNVNVTYRDQLIRSVTTYKYLGVEISHSLNMTTNSVNTYKKACGRMRLLWKIRPFLNVKAAKAIY